MDTKQFTTVDRVAAGWPSGEWDGEPDKVQWPDAETGLPCLAVRSHMGFWCGYVGVADGHPHYRKHYRGIDCDVHGGLTFSDMCQPGEDESRGICHVPGPGEPEHVWWLGFDCGHSGDRSPDTEKRALEPGGGMWVRSGFDSYKTLSYVQRQCASLAAQMAAEPQK